MDLGLQGKHAIVTGDASDIVGSSYFTGVFGNYLKPSIVRTGDSAPRLASL